MNPIPLSHPLALTMGDPVGIGPEIVLKACAARASDAPPWLWVGDPAVLAWTAHHYGLSCPTVEVQHPHEAMNLPHGVLAVLPTRHGVEVSRAAFGQPDPNHAPAIVESIQTACRLALSGEVAAVVTPPIGKAVLHAAGFHHPGHTEMLGECAGVSDPVMMLTGKGLRVIPATIHQSLRSVPGTLTRESLTRLLDITHAALQRDFGLGDPVIAVAGLNPHAGENGAFGDEEARIITPVCDALRQRGWKVRGPLPADTLFHEEARRGYDVAVCMYHDQALIPLKMLAFGRAVNVTLGLPIVRTSVDHGTAYDIAGQNRANPDSLGEALALAHAMAQRRARAGGAS